MVPFTNNEKNPNICDQNDKYGSYYSHLDIPPESLPKCDYKFLKKYFSEISQRDLIATLGGLQVHPCNHVHAVRLEIASQIACSINNNGNRCVNPEIFKTNLNIFLPTISRCGLQEDPPERLFTENIEFHGGNYIVYPSTYLEEKERIENLLRVLQSFRDEFSDEFIREIFEKAFWILWLSNEIASRLDHTRYQDSPYNWDSERNDIFVPHANELIKYRNSVIFNLDEIKGDYPDFKIEILKPFLTKIGKKKLQTAGFDSHILNRAPLVQIDNDLVVTIPGALLYTLNFWILNYAKKNNYGDLLAKRYKEYLWYFSLISLKCMRFEELDIDLPNSDDDLLFAEELFEFDKDKIAFVQFISNDIIKNFKSNFNSKINELKNKLEKRDKEVIEFLKTDVSDDTEIFFIKIFEGIKICSLTQYLPPENNRGLSLTCDELDIIVKSGKCDGLTLWKFVCCVEKCEKDFDILTFSFLDCFSLYLKNHTLFFDNKINSPFLPIAVGMGKDLRFEVANKWDLHLEPIGSPPFFVEVYNRNFDPNIPIYSTQMPIDNKICLFVKGYSQPIWIIYDDNIDNIPIEKIGFIQEFCGAVGYWLWQFTPKLYDYLSHFGEKPIHVVLKFENPSFWYNFNQNYYSIKNSEGSLKYRTFKEFIIIEIPDNFMASLSGPTNYGERVLCSTILMALSSLIQNKTNDDKLTDDIISDILEEYAPLGRKKQLSFVFAGANGLLFDNNLPEPRFLQEYDIEEQSLFIFDELGIEKPEDSLIHTNQSKICNQIVDVYYKKLQNELKKFHWKELMIFLISQNDSFLHYSDSMLFSFPYFKECFSEGFEVIKEMAEDQNNAGVSSLFIRTLIEILAAEPPCGCKRVNFADFDRLMAITNQLIKWANTSEFYYGGLMKSELIIHSYGRISIPDENLFTNFMNFILEKLGESEEGIFEKFKSETIPNKTDNKYNSDDFENKDILKELETPCKAEFGLTIFEIFRFFSCLIHSLESFICPEQEGPVYCLSRSQFIEKIAQKLCWDEEKVNRAINEFSLSKRDHWDEAPEGFEFNEDIEPWKYWRRLSYLRKPLIIGPEPKNDPVIMWGSLQSERSFQYLHDLIIDGRINTTTASPEMKAYLHKLQKEKGEYFNQYVKEWFEKNTNLKVFSNVQLTIKVGNDNTTKNLGDIDVLLISEEDKIIYSLECKDINFGRNAKEIVNEIGRLFKGTDKKSSWLSKHEDRNNWLKENYQKIISNYSLNSGEYHIISFIITSQLIPSVFFSDETSQIPIIPFTKIEKEGIEVLEKYAHSE